MRILLFLLFFAFPLGVEAARHYTAHHHRVHAHHRHRVVYVDPRPEILRGSYESRVYENTIATVFMGLGRFQTQQDVERAIRTGELVLLPRNRYVVWHPKLDTSRAYCRPYSAQWVESLGEDFYRKFGKPITVSSAVRPIEYQIRLARGGSTVNAAPADGLGASTHPTGSTIDVSYKDLSKREVAWLAGYLSAANQRGETHAIEETRGSRCFHFLVIHL